MGSWSCKTIFKFSLAKLWLAFQCTYVIRVMKLQSSNRSCVYRQKFIPLSVLNTLFLKKTETVIKHFLGQFSFLLVSLRSFWPLVSHNCWDTLSKGIFFFSPVESDCVVRCSFVSTLQTASSRTVRGRPQIAEFILCTSYPSWLFTILIKILLKLYKSWDS